MSIDCRIMMQDKFITLFHMNNATKVVRSIVVCGVNTIPMLSLRLLNKNCTKYVVVFYYLLDFIWASFSFSHFSWSTPKPSFPYAFHEINFSKLEW